MPRSGAALDRRPAADVGRRARLELTFAVRRGRTVLDDAYAEPPFRVGRWFSDGDQLHMIMASSAPGVFSGDCLQQTIRVERGARVRLTSQSALQVHPAPHELPARLVATYSVAADAELHCRWDPIIPFAGARIEQAIDMTLDEHACITWSDALMSGRNARDERWRFSSFAHQLTLNRCGVPEYLERYRLEPRRNDPARVWVAGDAAYIGTTIVAGWPVDAAAAAHVHGELASVREVRAAADLIAPRVLVVRLMAHAGPAFHAARATVDRTAAAVRAQALL
jgi:urease accessory protein